jgi:cell division protein ZapD
MPELSANVSEIDPDSDRLVFEQPLNERMRMLLRVEFLRRQAEHHAKHASDFSSRAAIASLLEILAITGRGDVRGDVLKELDRHAKMLDQYRRAPGVDKSRLDSLIKDVDGHRSSLVDAGKHFLSGLRENEFLNSIRHRSTIPGGTCIFDLPEYGYWLQSPKSVRATQLDNWMGQLLPLFEAVGKVLWLTRESTTPIDQMAEAGFFQYSLNKKDKYSLVRVSVDSESGLFPEISAGEHRFTVRFATWKGVEERAKQTEADVSFQLALC